MATALYRGDFLAGFYLDGSPAFEQWALLERERAAHPGDCGVPAAH